jgi:NhaP-type Na+/H+ or K+/H+ antiporter
VWAVPAIAIALLGYAAVSRRLGGGMITAPIVFTAVGLLLGPSAMSVIEVKPTHELIKLLAEVTLGAVLFADASRTNMRALRDEFRVPARLLGIGLPLTIAFGLVAALVAFGSMGWPEALVLAVVLAPTDAGLGQAVVTLPVVPERVRLALNIESGLNDGICVPVFFTAIAIASTRAGIATDSHAIKLLVEEIGYGTLFGVLTGLCAGAIVLFAAPRGLVDQSWLQIVPVAAAALAFTSADAVGGSGFVATFVAGLVFGGIRRRAGGEIGYLIDELGMLFGGATYVVFGAVLLEPALGHITTAVVLYALVSLTVVRMIPVAVALLGTQFKRQTVSFIGWFGPRGLASIVFAILITENTARLPSESAMLTTIYVTVGLSVLLHGLSAAPLARRFGAWSLRDETPAEAPSTPAPTTAA